MEHRQISMWSLRRSSPPPESLPYSLSTLRSDEMPLLLSVFSQCPVPALGALCLTVPSYEKRGLPYSFGYAQRAAQCLAQIWSQWCCVIYLTCHLDIPIPSSQTCAQTSCSGSWAKDGV